jgi:hypothetical protein
MRRIGGMLLTVTGFLACPCHLIMTLPLLLSLVAGTALGSVLSRNTGLVYAGASISFVVALALGALFLFGPQRSNHAVDTACPTCIPADAHESEPWPSSSCEGQPVTRRSHVC